MKISILFTALLFSVANFAQTNRTISVSGTATQVVKANKLRIVTGVSVEGNDAAELFEKSSTIMDAAIKYLNGKKKQCTFQTDIVRLQSQYYNSNRPKYISKQLLTVIITDFDSYDEIINKLVSMGFNSIQSTSFEIDSPDMLKAEVRKQAILAAKKKAKNTATLLDVELGDLQSFSESNGNYPRPLVANTFKADAAFSGSTHTLAPGEITFTVTVYVTYNIKEN